MAFPCCSDERPVLPFPWGSAEWPVLPFPWGSAEWPVWPFPWGSAEWPVWPSPWGSAEWPVWPSPWGSAEWQVWPFPWGSAEWPVWPSCKIQAQTHVNVLSIAVLPGQSVHTSLQQALPSPPISWQESPTSTPFTSNQLTQVSNKHSLHLQSAPRHLAAVTLSFISPCCKNTTIFYLSLFCAKPVLYAALWGVCPQLSAGRSTIETLLFSAAGTEKPQHEATCAAGITSSVFAPCAKPLCSVKTHLDADEHTIPGLSHKPLTTRVIFHSSADRWTSQ